MRPWASPISPRTMRTPSRPSPALRAARARPRGDARAGGLQDARVLERPRACRPSTTARLARLDAVRAGQARGAAPEEHAGQVVAGEDLVLARTRPSRPRSRAAVTMCSRSGPITRHLGALVDAERACATRSTSMRALACDLGEQLARRSSRVRPGASFQPISPSSTADHARARRGCAERGGQPGRAEADDEHVGVAVAPARGRAGRSRLVDTLPRPATLRIIGSTFGHAQLRLDQRLVVEADRQELVRDASCR